MESIKPGQRNGQAVRWRKLELMRRNKRRSEIKTLRKYMMLPDDDELRRLCRNRDPYDPKQVSAPLIGSCLGLTIATKMAIENKVTDDRIQRGFKRFRIITIDPCDVTPAEAKERYRRRRNQAVAAKRKAQRAEAQRAKWVPQEDEPMQTSFATYPDAIAAGRAHKQRQTDALYEAIDASEQTVADLMEAVCHHPAWRQYRDDKERLRRAISRALDDLKSEGGIADGYEAREQGGKVRIVWRKTQATIASARWRGGERGSAP